MADKKRMLDKERILRYLIRKGSLVNSYKVARELDTDRWVVLEILNELAREGKVRLRSGSVTAITEELRGEEIVKTKSEVEELKERIEKLEKVVKSTFSRLREAIPVDTKKVSRETKSKEELVHSEDTQI